VDEPKEGLSSTLVEKLPFLKAGNGMNLKSGSGLLVEKRPSLEEGMNLKRSLRAP
jgi:hypothetical protein